MTHDRPLATGDLVTITFDGRSVDGMVKLASPNGQSLMLQFEAILLGYLGQMPVLDRGDGCYRDLIYAKPVRLMRRIVQ